MASSLNEYLSAKNSNGLPSTPENLFNQQQSHQNYNHPQQSNHINGRLSRTPSTRRKAPSPMLAHDLCATPQAGMGSVGNFIKPSPQQSADMEYYSDEEDPMISMKNNNWFFEKQQTTEIAKEGWIWRRGALGSYKKSYAVARHQDAKAGMLFLFKAASDKYPFRTISLTECMDVRLKDIKQMPQRYDFKLVMRKSDVNFGCDSLEEASAWVKVLDALIPKIAEPAFERLECELISKDHELYHSNSKRGELENENKHLKDLVEALRRKEREREKDLRTLELQSNQERQNSSGQVDHFKRELGQLQTRNLELQRALTSEQKKVSEDANTEIQHMSRNILMLMENDREIGNQMHRDSLEKNDGLVENVRQVEGRVKWLQQKLGQAQETSKSDTVAELVKEFASTVQLELKEANQSAVLEKSLEALTQMVATSSARQLDVNVAVKLLAEMQENLTQKSPLVAQIQKLENRINDVVVQSSNTQTLLDAHFDKLLTSIQGLQLDPHQITDAMEATSTKVISIVNTGLSKLHEASGLQSTDLRNWLADLKFEIKASLSHSSKFTGQIAQEIESIKDSLLEAIARVQDKLQEQIIFQTQTQTITQSQGGDVDRQKMKRIDSALAEMNQKLSLGLFGSSNDVDSERSLRTLLTKIESRFSTHDVQCHRDHDVTHKSTSQIYNLLQHLQKTILEAASTDRPASPTKRKTERQVDQIEVMVTELVAMTSVIKSETDQGNANFTNALSGIDSKLSSAFSDKLDQMKSMIISTFATHLPPTSRFDDTATQLGTMRSHIDEVKDAVQNIAQCLQQRSRSSTSSNIRDESIANLTCLTEDLCSKERATSAALDGIQHSLAKLIQEFVQGGLLERLNTITRVDSKDIVDVGGIEDLRDMLHTLITSMEDKKQNEANRSSFAIDEETKMEVKSLMQDVTQVEQTLLSKIHQLKSQVHALASEKRDLSIQIDLMKKNALALESMKEQGENGRAQNLLVENS